jgi:hypothetical protein
MNQPLTPIRLYTSEEESQARFEALKLELAKPGEVRTQEAADRQWPTGAGRWRGMMYFNNPRKTGGWKPMSGMFPIEINADNIEQARSRYLAIMGINSFDAEVARCDIEQVMPVDDDAA